jgi:lysozyme family protein
MDFQEAVKIIMSPDFEGGYVFDSHDPGGETKFGISKRSYPGLDIKNLTEDDAAEIYRHDFWDPLKPLLLPERLRFCLFDCAINQGLPTAIKFLQAAVGTKTDGILGPLTIAAAQNKNVHDALKSVVMLRHERYAKNPNWPRYGGGWGKRLLLVTLLSLR